MPSFNATGQKRPQTDWDKALTTKPAKKKRAPTRRAILKDLIKKDAEGLLSDKQREIKNYLEQEQEYNRTRRLRLKAQRTEQKTFPPEIT